MPETTSLRFLEFKYPMEQLHILGKVQIELFQITA